MDFFAIVKVFKVDKVSSLNSRVTRPGIMHHSLVDGPGTISKNFDTTVKSYFSTLVMALRLDRQFYRHHKKRLKIFFLQLCFFRTVIMQIPLSFCL